LSEILCTSNCFAFGYFEYPIALLRLCRSAPNRRPFPWRRFLAELLRVDLSHNKIVTISSKAFASQGQLRELKLDNNKIGGVSNQTFYGLQRLEVLSFRGNLIEHLPDNLFQFAKNIQEIDFSRNRIVKVNPKAFQGNWYFHYKSSVLADLLGFDKSMPDFVTVELLK
jgi:Leucine-rich repeat (LRR) protein